MVWYLLAILKWFGSNSYILGLCSIVTLVGFLITVYVSLKTKSIDSVLKNYKRIEKFNKEGRKYKRNFENYQDSLINDDVPFRKLKFDILNDLRASEIKFGTVFNRKEKKCLKEVVSNIEIGNQNDLEYIANELSKVIAIFSTEKEC